LSVQKHNTMLACGDGKVTVPQHKVKCGEVGHMGNEFSLVTVQFKNFDPLMTASEEDPFAPPNRSRYSVE